MINKENLNLLQAYNAMRIFLSLYHEKASKEDIAMLLGGLRLFKDKEDWQENPETWDSPAWQDWMDGVNKTLQDLDIKQDPKAILYDDTMAYLCMKNYLQLLYNQFPFENIQELLKIMASSMRVESDAIWQAWLQAMKHAKHETYSLDLPLY